MSDNDKAPFFLLEQQPEERNAWLRADTHAHLAELKLCLAASTKGQESITELLTRYARLPESSPVTARSLQTLRNGRSTYLRLQNRLIELSKRYLPLVSFDQGELHTMQIDSTLRTEAVLISFVAALTLYDNHLAMRSVLDDSRLRRLLFGVGEENLVEDGIIQMLRALNSSDKQNRLRELATAYDKASDTLAAANDPDIDFLQMAVASSVAYRYARDALLQQQLPSTSQLWKERLMDSVDALSKSTAGTISELFGNGIGLVETRKGKLWNDAAYEEHLKATLQPLDLLLEKTPFRLTDKFIPGHFGHVALWVGTAAELSTLDLFSDPLFQQPRFASCEADVRAGHCVLEALRSGVQLRTLAEFLNVDDLAILRPQGLTPAQKHASLIRAFHQVGKEYDFNFEVQTLDEITCSELPYHVYPDVSWQTEEQLGQHTISPDQVASQAMARDAPFQLVEFCHDGQRVESSEALPLMAQLLGRELV
jgi:hypothetical protein